MSKCNKCNKSITKRYPGLECSRCEKVVHLTSQCSDLTNKQLAALRATEHLEWMCEECHKFTPKRRSIVIPDEEDESTAESFLTPTAQIDVKKLLNDISKEVERAIKSELREINESLQFHSNKMDEVIEGMEACKQIVQTIQRKQTELTNKNNHLEIRIGAMEQRIQDLEQEKLKNIIEISNIPFNDNENTEDIVSKIATKLQLPNEFVTARRLQGKRERPGIIEVNTASELRHDNWIAASRKTRITLSDIYTNSSNEVKIYINEALTPYNKNLLWSAKQELKYVYKYIWSKRGAILVRKESNDNKIYRIRSLEDIKKLLLEQRPTV